jgi:hypothetical protein
MGNVPLPSQNKPTDHPYKTGPAPTRTRRAQIRAFRRGEAESLHNFLVGDAEGFALPAWVSHALGVSKSAITKAVRRGAVRTITYKFPDGHTIELVSIGDCLFKIR